MKDNHDVLRMRKATDKTQGMKYVKKEKCQAWYADFKKFVDELGDQHGIDMWTDSSRFINMDETSCELNTSDGKITEVIAEAGARYVFRESAGKFLHLINFQHVKRV